MRRGLPWAALLVALILSPFVDRALGFQTVHAVSDGMIYVLLALGLNIVVGYAGLLDLGYAAFFADRKSTRLNSSHSQISYAVFCLKQKKPEHAHCHDFSH